MKKATPDNNNPKAKTIEQWSKIKKVTILDPDGFDRTDPNLFTNKYTEEEFFYGMIQSTIVIE